MASIAKRANGKYRARYRDELGQEHARHFGRKADAQHWLDEQTARLVAGTHIAPRQTRLTVAEWADTWLEGYAGRRESTVKQARHHLARIRGHFGTMQLSQIRPSHVKSWIVALQAEGLAPSYIYACHSRLAQLLGDAVHDGLLPKSPCSRRTSPPRGKARPYVATTEQVWALHDAMPDHLRPAVTLAAYAGLRLGEVCGLRVADVDFMRGILSPSVQYPAQPLKTEISRTPVPIPADMALVLAAHAGRWSAVGESLMVSTNLTQLAPSTLQEAFRKARASVPGLPAGFRFHDLRHYYASLLIASGADVKVVQARLRHASAMTTLDTYGHLWPDSEDVTRSAVAAAWRGLADDLRTGEVSG